MILGLIPVILFLLALVLLDSYKLVSFRFVLLTVLIGGWSAILALGFNHTFIWLSGQSLETYSMFGAPVVEELCKAAFLIYLVKTRRVGFMLDAAIYGFALGAGFAVVENVMYWYQDPDTRMLVWLIRGAGTAIMHGGATAVFGILTKNLSDRKSNSRITILLPGLVGAMIIHFIWNLSPYRFFYISTEALTLSILLVLPGVLILVYCLSERALKKWLGTGFDSDVELLKLMDSGEFSQSPIGQYLQSLQGAFPGRVVADMLCYLRLHIELGIRAKGILLLRKANLPVEQDPEVPDKFRELAYLEKSIGKTGKLAILPFLHQTDQDLWQLNMVDR